MPSVTVKMEVSDQTIRDLLVSALEGGSNYWYCISDYRFPEGVSYEDFQEGGQFTLDEYYHPTQLIPFHEGCEMVFIDVDTQDEPEREEFVLNKEALQRGLQVMADEYPKHFADATGEDWDAITADVYLQCCLFGKIVYG
jgi:hypothetical protein